MKKKFIEPSLLRCQLSLNESIAESWEDLDDGSATATYHFTYTTGVKDNGCYDYVYNNFNWATASYTGHYWPGEMNLWLARFYSLAETDYKTGGTSYGDGRYINCFGSYNLPLT